MSMNLKILARCALCFLTNRGGFWCDPAGMISYASTLEQKSKDRDDAQNALCRSSFGKNNCVCSSLVFLPVTSALLAEFAFSLLELKQKRQASLVVWYHATQKKVERISELDANTVRSNSVRFLARDLFVKIYGSITKISMKISEVLSWTESSEAAKNEHVAPMRSSQQACINSLVRRFVVAASLPFSTADLMKLSNLVSAPNPAFSRHCQNTLKKGTSADYEKEEVRNDLSHSQFAWTNFADFRQLDPSARHCHLARAD